MGAISLRCSRAAAALGGVLAAGLFAACGDDGASASMLDAGSGDAGAGCTTLAGCGDPPVVVDPAWLAGRLGNGVQVVDVRSEAAFETSHVTGALRVDPNRLRATVDGVGGQVVDRATAETVFQESGLLRNVPITVVGGATDTTAARVFWTLEYFGHGDVTFLDGGFPEWTAFGGDVASGDTVPVASTYTIDAVAENRRVEAEDVLAGLTRPPMNLVDARSAGEFAAGRIPGALHVDWMENVSAGRYRPRSDVAALYDVLDPSVRVAAYCQTGSRASVAYLTLRALGFSNVTLYDGSWAEWSSREDLPKEP